MGIKIGYGKSKITPPVGTELSGYGYFLNRTAESITDDLYCYTLAIEDGGDVYLLINCDLLGFDDALLDGIKTRISSGLGIPADKVMILATHTHTGPAVTTLVGCGEKDAAYADTLPALIYLSAEQAAADRRAVTEIRVYESDIEPIGYNRAIPDGPECHTVTGIYIRREAGRDIAVANYGCHPVTLGAVRTISADYPGRFVAAMAEKNIDAVFINAPCGDIDPVIFKTKWGSGTAETIDGYGRRIAAVFDGGSKNYTGRSTIRMKTCDIPVSLQRITENDMDAILDAEISKAAKNPGHVKALGIYRDYFKRHFTGGYDFTEHAKVQYLAAGDFVVVGLPYEAFTDIGAIIRRALPGKTVLTAGNANHVLGYLATAEKMRAGGYEATVSTYLYRRLPIICGEGERFAEQTAAAVAAGIY